MTEPDLEPRLPLERVATYLGCSRRHALALVQAGSLQAIDTRLPHSKRTRLTVSLSSLRAFQRARAWNARKTGRTGASRSADAVRVGEN